MGVGEFVGWRALAGEDTDGALYTMGLTEEPVVRCRDCRWYTPEFEYEEERGFGCHEKCLEPGCCLNPARCCTDVDQDGRRITVGITTEPDGYCKWGERR